MRPNRPMMAAISAHQQKCRPNFDATGTDRRPICLSRARHVPIGFTVEGTESSSFMANKPARSRFREFFRVALRFWTAETRGRAWGLTLAVLVFVAAQTAAAFAMNLWNRWFFDALDKRDVALVWSTAAWLPVLLGSTALSMSALVVSRLLLQVRWREHLTRLISGWWIADQRYYRLGLLSEIKSAPEYRIAEDVRLAIEPLVEMTIGLISAFATAATFAAVLWQVAGSAELTIMGVTVVVPFYMALAAILYAALASFGAFIAGRPLVGRVAAKNEMEARFRADMTRLRENAESIALIRGDADELTAIHKGYGRVVRAWLKIVRQQGLIALVLNTNSALFPVVPLLLIAPKYLSGSVTLGAVVQVVAAFSAVQAALIWFVDNFVRLAEWFASVTRVDELVEELQGLDVGTDMEGEKTIAIVRSLDDSIHIDNLSVAHSNGRIVIADATVAIAPGDKVLIAGESGSGKSTLIRALAGLWPWGAGSIAVPEDQTIAFLPQKPYLPKGSLRSVLLYPATDTSVDDNDLRTALDRCGLQHLAGSLGTTRDWDRILSGGERQRIAFARLLVQKPNIIVMDEATSALDDESQASMLQLFESELSYATIISVGHRAELEDFHERKILLERREAGARMTTRRITKSLWRLIRGRRSTQDNSAAAP